MSYEGYVQLLCAEGHLSEVCWTGKEPKRCRCGAKMVWRNAVDITNGSFEQVEKNGAWYDTKKRIDGLVRLKVKRRVYGACPHCHEEIKDIVKEIIYHIPEKKGRKI